MSYLRIESLVKSYGLIPAVKDLTLDVQRGELFAIVGPDGAGKTSLIRTICRLIDPTAGSILLDGQSLQAQFDELKPKLGYMPQTFSLYPDLTVEENLIFFAGIFGVRGEEYKLRRDRMYQFSQLGPFAKRRANALSGGMKQKLALSCALMHDPELLILDEPTTGVDPLSRRQFWEILASLKSGGTTILVCTPYMDEAARSDRLGFLFAGRLLALGTPAELSGQYRGEIYSVARLLSPEMQQAINGANSGVRARQFGAETHFHLPTDVDLSSLAALLAQTGILPSELTRATPSLEDRFIQLIEEAA